MAISASMRETGISIHDQTKHSATDITFIMHDVSTLPVIHNSPIRSPMRRHSASFRRPLRSSPLAGPALSGEGLIISNENAQGKPKPSRISFTPDLASMSPDFTIFPTNVPPLPSSVPMGVVATPLTSLKAPSAPSLQMLTTPSPSSRPPSRESTKSLPALTHTPIPPSFPRALHRNSSPTVKPGTWLTANPYGETPQFSRIGMSTVVMPVSVKEHRRRSLASVKAGPSLRDRSIVRTRSGTSSASSEEADTALSKEGIKKTRNIVCSLRNKMRKRASVVSMSSGTRSTVSSSSSVLYSRSVTSFSSVGATSDIGSSTPLYPRAPGSAHSRRSSISDCGTSNGGNEDHMIATPRVADPSPPASQLVPPVESDVYKANNNNKPGSLKSRTRSILRRSKSFGSRRVPADSVLHSTVAPGEYTSGSGSFASLNASDVSSLPHSISSSCHESDDLLNEALSLPLDVSNNSVVPDIPPLFNSSHCSLLSSKSSPPPSLEAKLSTRLPSSPSLKPPHTLLPTTVLLPAPPIRIREKYLSRSNVDVANMVKLNITGSQSDFYLDRIGEGETMQTAKDTKKTRGNIRRFWTNWMGRGKHAGITTS